MINKLSLKLSEKLGSKLKSTDDEKEIYAYSLEVIFSLVLNLIILSMAAYILGKIPELIIFIIFFSGLRTFAGGYHAKTHLECMTISIIIFLISAMSNTWFHQFGTAIMIIGIIMSILLVFFYAPTDSENKPLSKTETTRFMIISRGTVILFSLVIIFLYYNRAQTDYIYITAVVAMTIESLSLINLLNRRNKIN